MDQCIFQEIHVHDEYALRKIRFKPDRDIVLDIGGHAGYFALAALLRGAAHVHLFEMSAENVALCRKNLQPFLDRVTIHHAAVWHTSGHMVSYGSYPEWDGATNTGGLSPYDGGDHTVQTVAFDEVIHQLTEGFQRPVRYMKLDAEGAEWPILLTSKGLHAIEILCGEYHEFGGAYDEKDPSVVGLPGHKAFTRELLARHLRKAGFRVRLPPAYRRWGLFYAQRPFWRRRWARSIHNS